ncbi:MAG: ssDNA-binding Zn-finger/Zn-ribbon topoisomerase 1 [Arenicella sp.]
MIAFVGDSTFKTDMPENVTRGAGYVSYIKSKQKEVLTQEQVQKIKALIESNSLAKSFKTNIQHTKHVKNIIAEKEQPKEPACPKCGSSMVKRKARKGKYAGNEFYGCPTYP